MIFVTSICKEIKQNKKILLHKKYLLMAVIFKQILHFCKFSMLLLPYKENFDINL